MRGATGKGFKSIRLCQISIHAPHAGSDRNGVGFTVDGGDFNPRSPCGERPLLERRGAVLQLFQSTLPMRGATFVVSDLFFYVLISIHAPHAGSDVRAFFSSWASLISIHAPHAGSDCPGFSNIGFNQYFNPRSPCGERRP